MKLGRGRFFWWLIAELINKYRKAIVLGCILGIGLAFFLTRIQPLAFFLSSVRVERIGLVGEFTPTTLPEEIQRRVSIGLTRLATDGSATPGVATRWEATDSGKTYVFHLNPDITWHDGKKLEAKDINYNIRDVTFTPVDATTIRVQLPAAYGPFETVVSKPLFGRGLIGVGEYRVAAIRLKGDTVEYLKLVPVGAQGSAYEFRFYHTEAAATLAYKLGDVDIIEGLSTKDPLVQWGNPQVDQHVSYRRIVGVFFNMRDTILKEKPLRQALAYSIPRQEQEQAISPISKTSWAYTDSVRTYDEDVPRAKKLFESARVATTSSVTITTFPSYVDLAQAIADRWSALGLSTAVRVERTIPSDYQVIVTAIDVPPDPDQYAFWHSTQASAKTNITAYANAKIDKLLEDARQEGDRQKRKNLYVDFQKRLMEDVPAVFLYYPKTYTISRHPANIQLNPYQPTPHDNTIQSSMVERKPVFYYNSNADD